MNPSAYQENVARDVGPLTTGADERTACLQALSHPRLNSYRRFFDARDDGELLGLYQWNDDLSALFFRSIAWLEVVLRNQFHRAMSLRYGSHGADGSRDWYLHVLLEGRSLANIEGIVRTKRRGRGHACRRMPSPDDVISSLTFGFWPRLLDVKTDVLLKAVKWGPILIDVLPGHRQREATFWAKPKHRDALFARIDLCNELRNRIAHHEPIWKLGELWHEGRARHGVPLTVEGSPPATPEEALARLTLIYDRVVELLGWLSPAIARRHKASDTHRRCVCLLSSSVLQSYRRNVAIEPIDTAEPRPPKG